MRRRAIAAIGVAVAVGAAGLNAIAYAHAGALTTFVPDGQRTPSPEDLSPRQKLETLLFGVTVPKPRATQVPEDFGLSAVAHTVAGPAGTLSLLVFAGGPRVAVVVHGYAAERSQVFPTVRRLVDLGYTVVAPDLRGAGASDGQHTTLGYREADDVVAVTTWVADTLGDDAPLLYGFSMGGAAIVGAVGRQGVDARALVLEATYDRLSTTVAHRFEVMGLPSHGATELLLFWGGVRMGLDPWSIAPADDARQVHVPTLVVAGDRDLRVHPDESRALAEAFGDHGRLVLVEGLPHAQLAKVDPDRWDTLVAPFLAEVAPP